MITIVFRSVALVICGVFAVSTAMWNTPVARANDAGPALAMTDFLFLDTSNEKQDHRLEHQERLAAFNAALRNHLATGGRFQMISLSCGRGVCGAELGGTALVESARSAGAHLLLLGGIQKMSTLVGWARVQIVDLDNGKIVFEKLLSFRGDDDEAWHRAEQFVARDLQHMNIAGVSSIDQAR
jgi:hypothetical protein